MILPPFVRTLASPLWELYKRLLSAFPVAIEPGSFLHDDSPPGVMPLIRRDEPTLARVGWQLVTSRQYEEPQYLAWCGALHTQPSLRRKQWEWVYILEALAQKGALVPGARGLGFGCGKEPIAAMIARRGCFVTATDLAPGDAAVQGWIANDQHASRLRDIRFPEICPDAELDERVVFRPCDMNDIPADLRGFDFLWSSCALEHLGTLEHGMSFIERSLECLRPGGLAVHTTEFNLGSNDRTLKRGAVSIYRKRDIEELAARLLARGCQLETINFSPGSEPPDLYVDVPPYKGEFHLRLLWLRHLITSIGIVVRKAP